MERSRRKRKDKNSKYKVIIHDVMRQDVIVPHGYNVRFEINGNLYRVKIDQKTDSLKIDKIGVGSVRGEVDRVVLTPETSYSFYIK